MVVFWNRGTAKSSSLVVPFIINHLTWGTPISWNLNWVYMVYMLDTVYSIWFIWFIWFVWFIWFWCFFMAHKGLYGIYGLHGLYDLNADYKPLAKWDAHSYGQDHPSQALIQDSDRQLPKLLHRAQRYRRPRRCWMSSRCWTRKTMYMYIYIYVWWHIWFYIYIYK